VISIGPILAVPELRDALAQAPAPVVAVSPLPGGQVVKGPTAEFMAWRGVPLSGEGVASVYEGLIDGLVSDAPVDGMPTLVTELVMADAAGRRRLAGESLEFASGLDAASDRRR
jgi:LPPG:FO 2-phospho-L-lactate transferase